MSGLPEGWIEVPLHEIADVIRGVTYKKEESADASKHGFVAVLRATNITGMSLTFEGLVYVPAINVSTEQLLRTGDVVVASSSGSKEIVGKAGAFARDGFIGSFGAFCTGVRPSPQLSSALFGYYFQTPSYRKSVSAMSAGSNINNLKAGDLASQVFPLAPHAEQIRIVAKLEELLSELDAGVAELKAAQKKLQQYRQSLLKAAVEGALTAPWREAQRKLGTPTETGAQLLQRILTERRARWEAKQLAKFKEQGKALPKDWQKKYLEPQTSASSEFANLPDGWCRATTALAGTVLLGRQRAPQYLTGRWPRRYLRVANIKDNWIDFSDIETMDFDEVHFEKYKLLAGDILVSEGQSPELVGQSAMFSGYQEPLCFQKTLHRFRAEPDVALAEYAQLVFRSHVYTGVFRRLASITTNIAHLTLEKFEAAPFPLPPLAEQAAIVAIVELQLGRIEAMKHEIQKGLAQSTAQRQNILRAAFAGQLIPQDPNDEPASVLLERIRAERAAQAAQKKPRASKARAAA